MVFGLFSKERSLKRTIDKATNRLAQSQDRWAAMEKLRENGGDEALFALCKRFSFSSDKLIEDQQEKGWVIDSLTAIGEDALEPLRRFMGSSNQLAYPLSLLERIASPEKALEIVDEILAQEEPGYTRDPQRRMDVIEWLSEWTGADDETIAKRIIPYVADFDENVRFKSVEGLSLKPCDAAAAPLVDGLLNPEEESLRLKLRIAEVLAEHSMSLGERKKEVSTLLEEELKEFRLHRDKLQKKRK